MADRPIDQLTAAEYMTDADLFAISQGGQAKSVTWATFYSDLAEALDGHGGINGISYTPPVEGSVDGTLTITMADGTTSSFTVKNGEKGDKGDKTYVHFMWSAMMPTQDSDMTDEPAAWIGVYAGDEEEAPTDYTKYAWYEYKGEKGDTGNGISSVTLLSSSGLVDTYRILFDNQAYTDFQITNGSQIDNIAKTSSVGLTDVYTVTLTDGSTTSFEVSNGKGIVEIVPPGTPGLPGRTDRYTVLYNDGDTSFFDVYNGTNGTGSVSAVDGIDPNNGNVPLLLFGSGAPTVLTPGLIKQRYFDTVNSQLYVCVDKDEENIPYTYTWRGASVTVDSSLSTSSTNPVQNAVLATIIGTTTLPTTAQTLTGGINETYLIARGANILSQVGQIIECTIQDYTYSSTFDYELVLSSFTNFYVRSDVPVAFFVKGVYTASDIPTSSTRKGVRISSTGYYFAANQPSLKTGADVKALLYLPPLGTGSRDITIYPLGADVDLSSVISGKKVSIIGDSISTFDAEGYKTEGYVQYYPNVNIPDVATVEDTWWKQVLDASGCVIEKNASYSGSRVTNTAAGKPSFCDRCNTTILGSPDTIIVALGTNDSGNNVAIGDYDFTSAYTSLSEATFATAYRKGLEMLKVLYPNAEIVCVALYMGSDYVNVVVRTATALGLKYVVTTDYEKGLGSHPNAHGMRQIASAFLALQKTDSVYETAVFPQLYTENGHISMADESYTLGTPPASNVSGKAVFWKDSQNTNVAAMRFYERANGENRLAMFVWGTDSNNAAVSQNFYLAIDGNGNPKVVMTNPEAWRIGLGLCYAVNDTFSTVNTGAFPGYVSTSGTTIYFDVPVDKSMENITTVSVTACTGAARGTSGYIDGSSSSTNWKSGYTVTAVKVSNYVVRINVAKSSAMTNVTNNTVCSMAASVSLKFT